MLAEGLGNNSIARRLSISEHTVKFHVSSIFTKLICL
nr:helix-turn-helix transcriptional regulator [Gloeocapsopsis dulcis]